MTENWYGPDAATFGDRVAAAREAAGMTQEQLAKRMGIKLKTLRAWEDDLSEPRANKLSMMAGMLNVSIMWLLNGEGEGLDAPSDATELSGDVIDILTEMRELRTQLKGQVERLARLEKKLRLKLKAPSE
ncbi:helix-turn-helix transcriptional regulator [Mesobacterium sp. TK19101]|uniref:Helix-turn-helix transcriptional regulator n=1 Tax=Mesobacterium hydrothermale TaxID=3111907 RepID=A0ABU6HKN4_9RHOB|nr:helix-turn-helix transcriptional regulator [Mesobacterium sp. TK19101]MEC3863023.1 helix-turn-helix transcriptional regulator [Mesobacterium sp. TK19101]